MSLLRPRNEVNAGLLAYSFSITTAQLLGFIKWAHDRHVMLSRMEAGPSSPRLHLCRVNFQTEDDAAREAYLRFVEPDISRFACSNWPIKPATQDAALALEA